MTRTRLGKGAYGTRGHTVRLWIEGDRIMGQYRAGPPGAKSRKKRTWVNTAENRAYAKVWAEELARTLAGRGGERQLVTTRVLFERYAEAEFSTLRPRSQRLAQDAWRTWERFVGPTTIAEDLGPETLAEFRGVMERAATRRGAGYAVSTIGKTIGQVKGVYAWGYRHRLLSRNDVRDYRFKVGKEQRAAAPPEYTAAEVAALEAVLPLDSDRGWRVAAVFRLANLLGGRQNAIRHLRWDDIDLERHLITWRAKWDKNGREDTSPLRPAARAVLEAIRHRTEGVGYVFPAASGKGVYTAQSAIAGLRVAERRAGVASIPGRAFHGLRRKHFNDVLEASSGDVGAAAAALRDTDLRVLSKSYLKKRNPKLEAVYEAMDAEEGSDE